MRWKKLTTDSRPESDVLVLTTNYNFDYVATGFILPHMTSEGEEYGLYDYDGTFLCDANYFILATDLLKLRFDKP